MVQWCWLNFQCWGVLLIWNRVGQGPTALVVGAVGGCLDIFSLVYHFSFLSPSLWETARYRLKYCLKGLLSPKNQPTNHCHMLPLFYSPAFTTIFRTFKTTAPLRDMCVTPLIANNCSRQSASLESHYLSLEYAKISIT